MICVPFMRFVAVDFQSRMYLVSVSERINLEYVLILIYACSYDLMNFTY